MMRKFLGLFSVNSTGDSPKDPKDGQGSEQSPADQAKNPGNTPQSTKPEGPPDLDDLWRDFNDRLGNLFGGKKRPPAVNFPSNGAQSKPRSSDILPPSERKTPPGNGGNGDGMGGPDFNFTNPFGSKASILVAVVAVLIFWLFSGFFIIQEGQAGVILTFGKYDYTAKPGINWHMPWPIQNEETVNLSGVRSVEVGRPILIKATNQKDSSMLTEDENIIDVQFAVQYRLKDPTDYLFNNRDPDTAVVQAAETAVREIVARSKMDTVLYEGREKIALDLAASIQKILDSYQAGIFVTSVTVQNVQPPEQVQAAFDDAVKAGQDEERLKSEGQAYANDIIPRAKGTAARLIQEAEGYKSRVVSTAEGDAARFKQIYVEYAKAPQVTRDRMYIDTMRDMYSNVSKVLVDVSKSNSLLYLPLDKMIAQVNAESSQVATPTGSVTVGGPSGSLPQPAGQSSPPSANPTAPVPGTQMPANNASVDKRDSLRSRDRDSR
ncbi:FtsH protease activity modulator HflK [Polynucleobacter sphagniphilus]|uniref:FtsH protease activity modulator HflK n=1 Tax=Polynucleobacter sphagniphilus TaxID=1743169 RepID=UPI0024738A0C|nr:FtsH protease activity modulator HflK [Polynucleobacter sphagniphilus]